MAGHLQVTVPGGDADLGELRIPVLYLYISIIVICSYHSMANLLSPKPFFMEGFNDYADSYFSLDNGEKFGIREIIKTIIR